MHSIINLFYFIFNIIQDYVLKMHTCMVCGNSARNTMYTRSEHVYHKLPKNENLRKIWLEVLGIGHCSIWQRVCSDHFLVENYKPGMKRRILFRNTIPQPYYQNSDQNGFPNNYIIQINDVETGNNAVPPMEQNIEIKEEDIGNTVINNFKTQRQTIRKKKSTRNNDDMNYYEYLPRPIIEKSQIPTVIETEVKPVSTATKDFEPYCSIPGCISNITNTDEVPYHFSPTIESTNSPVNSGLIHTNKPLCVYSRYVENVESKDTHTSLINNDSTNQVVNLVPSALPIPMDAWRSASNVRNNLQDVIESRNLPSTSHYVYKPTSSTSDCYVNMGSNDAPLLVYNTTYCSTKDIEYYCSIPGCISNITITEEGLYFFSPTKICVNEWSSALGVQLTINCHICERHFRPQDFFCEEILVDGLKKVVKLLVHSALPIPINAVGLASNNINNLPDNSDKCSKSHILMAIDDFPNIDSDVKQKLKFISAKNSLSISLEATSTLKMQNNKLPDNTNKSSKSNTFVAIDGFTNIDSDVKQKLKLISAKNSLSVTLEATSALKMLDKLSSNTVICPEFIDNQITFLKCISPKNKSNSSKSLEIMSPLVTKLEGNSDIHDSNSDFSTNTSQCDIIDYGNTEEFKMEDHELIFEISKTVILPSLFWTSTHLRKKNTTAFCYRSFFENTEKKIFFHNSLVPVVHLYGKKYKYNKPITTKYQLEHFLEKIDDFEKCSGGYGLVYQKCIGYFDGSSEDTEMCSACQEWATNQDLQKLKESKFIKCLKSKVSFLDQPKP